MIVECVKVVYLIYQLTTNTNTMSKFQNTYTTCKFTNKEIFSNEFACQPVNEFFASIMVLLIRDSFEGNGPDRVEKAIQNSYTKDMQKKIFYTIGLLLKNYK